MYRLRLIAAVAAGIAALPAAAPGAASARTARERTVRVSLSNTGAQGDRYAGGPVLSRNGRYVAFYASSTNLVPGDTNGLDDVFVRDRWAPTTTRVSVSSGGVQGNAASGSPAISADGRYVAFISAASNLVSGDTNNTFDVFVRDRSAATTTRVSVSSAEVQGNAASESPAISADGRYVTFQSRASTLVPGDTNNTSDVFVRDLRTGTTSRVSVSSRRGQANNQNEDPAISAHGRYVAFWSVASNLVTGDTNGLSDVFVHDRRTNTTTRVSLSDTGAQGLGTFFGSHGPAISADGRYVAFVSDAVNLVLGDTNGLSDVFVRDLAAGTTRRISTSNTGVQANGYCYLPAISADGRYIVFGSAASNLVPGDTNNQQDVFLHNQLTGRTIRVSVSTRGAQAGDATIPDGISADGRHIGFTTAAGLVPDDTNEGFDAYVHDRP